jgi:ADP-heptose:LPS heptosyltransferase
MTRHRGLDAPFPASVIVDLPNWLGDLVMALPALDRLRRANQGGRTVVLARPRTERLVRALFPDADVLSSPRREGALATAARLRRRFGRFDLGLTFRNAARAKITLWRVARHTVGSPSQGGRLLLSASPAGDRSAHQIFDQDPLLESLGVESVDPSWRPALPAALVEEGRRVLADVLNGAPGVGLAPGVAGGEIKRWSPHAFGELAGRLSAVGLEPVVLVGPGERELAERVIRAAGRPVAVAGLEADAAGLAGLAAALSAVVGNDSGAGHVASLGGTPVISLFGPTDPARTAPRGGGVTVCRHPASCAPCGRLVCREAHRICLDRLGVETVLDAVRAVV